MVEIAPSSLDSLQEAAHWVPKDRLDEFLSLLQPDNMLFRIIPTVQDLTAEDPAESSSAKLVSTLVSFAKTLLERTPPKLPSTYDYLERSFKDMGVEDEGLMTSISDLRAKTLEAVHEQRPDQVYPELNSWLGRK